MEDALVRIMPIGINIPEVNVLILVLMEDALVQLWKEKK